MSCNLMSLGRSQAFEIETEFEATVLFSVKRLQIEEIIRKTYHIYVEDPNRKKFNGEKGIGIYLFEFFREESDLFLKIKKEESTCTPAGSKQYLPVLMMTAIHSQLLDSGLVINPSVQMTYNPDDSVAVYLGENLFPKKNLKEKTPFQKVYERIKAYIG